MPDIYWNPNWEPHVKGTPYKETRQYGTKISRFENGKEQRRKKQSAARRIFLHSFDVLTEAEVTAIRNFFEARYGSYESFYYPNYNEIIKGTTLACVDNGASADTITDSGNGFVARGFVNGQKVIVGKSGTTNNGIYTITNTAVGVLTLTETTDVLANESANANLTVFRTYLVRFGSDEFEDNFKTDDNGFVKGLELIEDI